SQGSQQDDPLRPGIHPGPKPSGCGSVGISQYAAAVHLGSLERLLEVLEQASPGDGTATQPESAGDGDLGRTGMGTGTAGIAGRREVPLPSLRDQVLGRDGRQSLQIG